MNDSQKEKWGKIRERGKGRYIFINGLLFQGIPFATVIIFADFFFRDWLRATMGLQIKQEDIPAPEWFMFIKVLIITGKFILAASGFGALMGLFTWWLGERSYQQTILSEKRLKT